MYIYIVLYKNNNIYEFLKDARLRRSGTGQLAAPKLGYVVQPPNITIPLGRVVPTTL